MHIPTKFEGNPVSGCGEEVENVIVDGRRTMLKAQLSDNSAELKMFSWDATLHKQKQVETVESLLQITWYTAVESL